MWNRRNDWVPFGPNESDWVSDDIPVETDQQRLKRLRQELFELQLVKCFGSKEKALQSIQAVELFNRQMAEVEGLPQTDLYGKFEVMGKKAMAEWLERLFKRTS